MFSINTNELASSLKQHWSNPLTLVVGTLAILGVTTTFFISFDSVRLTKSETIFTVLLATLFCVFWYFTNRTPTHKKRSIGIGLAIECNDQSQARKLKEDFIANLHSQFSALKSSVPFHLIVHKNTFSKKLNSTTDPLHYIQKTRAHLFLYGTAKLRTIDGKTNHVLKLDGIIRHSPLRHESSKYFQQEFRNVLLRKLVFEEDSDIFKFELTADALGKGALYIVGVTAMLSGDLTTSEQLLLRLKHELKSSENELPNITRIKELLPVRLANLYENSIRLNYHKYYITRDKNHLIDNDRIFPKLETYNPNWYPANLQKAINDFVLRRDINSAYEAIERCKDVNDTTWLYSLGFLRAYEGDLSGAWHSYKKAFRNPPNEESVPNQSEEFVAEVLREEPDKFQLYFCLGLINHRAKNDSNSALSDFESFISDPRSVKYPRERELCKKWINQINITLNRHQ